MKFIIARTTNEMAGHFLNCFLHVEMNLLDKVHDDAFSSYPSANLAGC